MEEFGNKDRQTRHEVQDCVPQPKESGSTGGSITIGKWLVFVKYA